MILLLKNTNAEIEKLENNGKIIPREGEAAIHQRGPAIPEPEYFTGDRRRCSDFLLQLELYFRNYV